MRIEVDLKNSNYKIITNEGAKCGFCNKDLKPIGFDYLYVNYDKSMIEYERCNCEKAVQFWTSCILPGMLPFCGRTVTRPHPWVPKGAP